MSGANASKEASVWHLPKLAGLVAELAVLLLVIYYFKLENRAFFNLSALAFGGFVIHYFLPFRYRVPFFLLLSVAGAVMILGEQAAWLVGVGLVLVGICHLPAPFWVRVVTLLVVGGLLMLMRGGLIDVPWSAAIWPILGSMFMFRLILYMYDQGHTPAPASIWQRLSYFFMLPNVGFPLFPVVDYRTFLRTYYNGDRHEIYQLGVLWIFRGLTQLILYRLVYYYLSMAPSEVEDIGDLARYVVSGFLLYLRISGQFHIIVGMLRLFGFGLPETHHLYFLSNSFTDFWRRINIYWKDFMMTIFFYPAYFALRKRGEMAALLASTALVFLCTWVLHAYQWFWIRGSSLLAWHDVLFWSILAALVLGNTAYEKIHGRERLVSGRQWTVGRAVRVVLTTSVTFAVITLLWSLWSSASVGEWIAVWRAALAHPTVSDSRLIPAAILGLAVFAGATLWFARRERDRIGTQAPAFVGSVATVLVSTGVVCLVGTPEIYAHYLPSRIASTYYDVVRSTREVRLSGHDADMLERGYYEDLLSVQRFNSQLWELQAAWPVEWSRLEDTGALQLTGDFLRQKMSPLKTINFRNATLTTNRWGMRDRDYEQVPPPGVHRLALVGSSHVMGYGVDDDETFDAVVERKLNESTASNRPVYEVLNFAVDGYTPLQELLQLERDVLTFKPHVVLYVAHWGAPYRSALHLAEMGRLGVTIPYPELQAIAARARIAPGVGRFESEQRIRPFQHEILAWAYRRMVAATRSQGAEPVWVYLPQIGDHVTPENLARFVRTAEDAGFTTISLENCFDGADPKTVVFGEWDRHPNVLGHRLIAEELFERLRERGMAGAGATAADGIGR